MQREFLKPFAIKKGETLRIPAEFSAAGILRLQVVQGGPIYGFRGGVSVASAESRTNPEGQANVDFDFAANANSPCVITLERDIGEITLYCPKESNTIGFLQFIEACGCAKG